jgi:hypothetical protein
MKLCGVKSRHSLVASFLLILSMTFSSCVQNGGLRSRSLSSTSSGNITGGTGTGNNAVGGETGVPGIANGTTVQSQMVELSHFVDPVDGSYKKKLTLPKNFKGNLYLSGLNVSSLASKIIKVRFSFGRERQAIVMGATLARAPGIVPNTSIQVLVVDMNNTPFGNMRLGYDLFDYNDYNAVANANMDVATDPRDGGLYCRGLLLADDPTFLQGQGSKCDGSVPAAVCKYSYAKITDATLQYPTAAIDPLTSLPFLYDKIPTRVQAWVFPDPAPANSAAFLGNMCLPDINAAAFSSIIATDPLLSPYGLPAGLKYVAPYRSINQSEWQISLTAITSATGLYAGGVIGFQSLLFPRAGKLQLGPNINYYGSVGTTVADKFTARTLQVSGSTGTTNYVDGCNLRTQNYDPATNESIGSCNVSASIEVFYTNSVGQEVIITKDNALKLQLIRPSTLNYLGQEVLASAFKSCSSSSTCGASECCYNSRCWSKDLVTQCVDQLPIVGNQVIGANCTSDFECSSLCCNSSTGSCAPHDPNGLSPNFCSKSPGQQCVTKEFCRKDFISECKVYFMPGIFKADGVTPVCTLRCAPVESFGNCLASRGTSTCTAPIQTPVPTQAAVDACTNAQ